MIEKSELIESNLLIVLAEVAAQLTVGKGFSPDLLGYAEQIRNIREWIADTKEYGVAYESLVCLLEAYPFVLSGNVAVKLLEVGLLMGRKTDRLQDEMFRLR